VKEVDLTKGETHFAFGKNWRDYAAKIDEARIGKAVEELRKLGGVRDFAGLSFLDIGSGSGLHSLAALRMGASRVVGVDNDPDYVSASPDTLSRFAPGADAVFRQVSVFDMAGGGFKGFDVVYSWGVLHHTGDMRGAIGAAASLVEPGGVFMLALYRKTLFCGFWRMFKRWYAYAPPAGQRRAMSAYVAMQRLWSRAKGMDFDAHVAGYEKYRGMNYYNDVHDWLGGYPYESMSPRECHELLAGLGFACERQFVKRNGFWRGVFGSGCDEYVFRRVGPATAARGSAAVNR
jgi:2-polyprenyl-6-hydroxyphenyl methylase/3-demethylubiquinone-9 3-methyltransferase